MNERFDIHNSDIPVICQSCEARHKGVCGALSPQQLQRLAKYTNKSSHEPKTDLSHAVMSDGRYANILSGVVKLSKLAADGRQQIVGLQFAPDFMGRPFSNSTDVDAIASTNVRICSFPVAVLEQIMEETPGFERKLHQQTVAELDEAREWLFALGRKSAREKVASFLHLIVTHSNPNLSTEQSVEIELPLKRADVADFLGLTIETVSRQITNLRKNGLCEVIDRNRIRIIDIDALKRVALISN